MQLVLYKILLMSLKIIINCVSTNLRNVIYNPMITDFEVRSKIVKIFNNHNPLEEYSVKIYKIDLYFL